jgi:hypothetical protein
MSTFAVELVAEPLKRAPGAKRLPNNKEYIMRFLEGATSSLVALAAQVLFVGTLFI